MKSTHIQTAERPGDRNVFATLLLEGDQSNVRIIRLAAGQALPPHRHGASDLMLYAIAGDGVLETTDGGAPFSAGALAFYRGDEELKIQNTGSNDMTLLAFLAPKFPPTA
jgi:quercetin dioxygenase-like cupin family protein